jgi:hypothetical protein
MGMCEHGDEPLGSISKIFLDKLGDNQLFK